MNTEGFSNDWQPPPDCFHSSCLELNLGQLAKNNFLKLLSRLSVKGDEL